MVNHSNEGLLPELRGATRRPAGFLGLISRRDGELLRLLWQRQIPAVNLSSRNPPDQIDSAIHDDQAIGRMAAEHLARMGERSYGFVGLGENSLSANRLSGFRDGLSGAGVRSQVSVFGSDTEDLESWIAGLSLPAALFCANDARARAVAQRVERLGVEVPDELAILGVDNDPVECQLTRIPLSSIGLRFEELGYHAAERLWALYCGEPVRGEPLLFNPSHVEVRLSTDSLAVADAVVGDALRLIRQPQPGHLTVADVAAGIGVSRRVLEKRFRRTTGRTVFTEIHACRMERARRLVEETHLSLDAISERIGLSDTKRFAKLFKEYFGKTPLRWRQERQH